MPGLRAPGPASVAVRPRPPGLSSTACPGHHPPAGNTGPGCRAGSAWHQQPFTFQRVGPVLRHPDLESPKVSGDHLQHKFDRFVVEGGGEAAAPTFAPFGIDPHWYTSLQRGYGPAPTCASWNWRMRSPQRSTDGAACGTGSPVRRSTRAPWPSVSSHRPTPRSPAHVHAGSVP